MKYLFTILFVVVLLAAAPAQAAAISVSTDAAAFSSGFAQPHSVKFDVSPYNSSAMFGGVTYTSVKDGTFQLQGLNTSMADVGVVVGADASDLGYTKPVGRGDNILAIENNSIVSDYGPLTSTLSFAFVTVDTTTRAVKLGLSRALGLGLVTTGSGTVTLHRADTTVIGTATFSNGGFLGISSPEPISFAVVAFAVPQGSGIDTILFDGQGLGLLASSGQGGTTTTGGTTPGATGTLPGPTIPAQPIGKVLGATTAAPGIVVGAQAGRPPEVRLYTPEGVLVSRFNAYEEHFRGGVQVAMGDIDGNGSTEIITAPGKGSAPQIRIFNLSGKFITGFFAYSKAFRGGVNLAVSDIEGDGIADIVTAPKAGGGPNIRIFSWRKGVFVPTVENFFAYDPAFRGGVVLALGDVDGDKQKDIITAPESKGGPQLRLFSYKKGVYRPSILGLMAYDPAYTGGVTVAAGDLDGDGRDEVVTGMARGGSQLRTFGLTARRTLGFRTISFSAFAPEFTGGVNIAVQDYDDDGKAEIIAAVRSKGDPLIRFFHEDGSIARSEWLAFGKNRQDGVTIAPGYLE